MSLQYKLNPFTGLFDMVEHAGGPAGTVNFLNGDTGGNVGPDGGNAIHIDGGTGISVDGDPLTNTLFVNVVGGGIDWSTVLATPKAMAISNGYITTLGGLTTFTLPAASAIGDVIEIIGQGAGGWRITQAAGQSIREGNVISTVGAAGTVNSTNRYDTIQITCIAANTSWQVTKSTGVLNYL